MYRDESNKDSNAAFFMVFDEVDKAQGFNFYTPFLQALEERFEPATASGVIILQPPLQIYTDFDLHSPCGPLEQTLPKNSSSRERFRP